MERNYQNLFDQISMPEDRAQALRTRLTSHCSPIEQEVIPMKETKKLRRPAMALAAALLICALSVTAFAAGDKIVNSLYSFMTGGTIEEGITAS
ncbi:MAG: hypothetical protein Q4C76_06570 [Bacillota bacterium]|nr:hypothetical protein [Bacillota bacterium]